MTATNQNQKMTDYKSYSLSQLKNWIHDAISCGEASPHEIYSTIKNTVQEEYNIHKEYSQRCFGLLELLNGHRPVNFDDTITFNFDSAGNDVSVLTDKLSKWIVPVEVDGASGEYYLQLPEDLLDTLGWQEGDTLEYADNGDGSFSVKKVKKTKTHDEMKAEGWSMTDDGFWIKE